MSYRRPDSFFSKGLLFRSVCLVMLITIVYVLKLFTEATRPETETAPQISVPLLTPNQENNPVSNFFEPLGYKDLTARVRKQSE